MKKFCILGATGSIGSQALDIILENSDYCLDGFSFGNNIDSAKKIIDTFKPNFVYSPCKDNEICLRKLYPTLYFCQSKYCRYMQSRC